MQDTPQGAWAWENRKYSGILSSLEIIPFRDHFKKSMELILEAYGSNMLESTKKYLCPLCHTNPIYDSTGNPILSEAEKCDCCGKYICRSCYYTDVDINQLSKNNDLPTYISGNIDPSWEIICEVCMNNMEKDYIDEIPKEDLPTHINTQWCYDENETYYRKKLEEVPHDFIQKL